jgi:transcription initiation factor TFIIIB Brf1 subunit/transcription initiation factor TFIIB
MHEITSGDERVVRDGQRVLVTCSSCGCRLDSTSVGGGVEWYHYGRLGGRDARGCRVACVDSPHDARGRAAVAA